LYVVCNRPGDPLGGAEEMLLEILRRAQDNGRERSLVVAAGEGVFTDACRQLGLDPILVPMRMPPLMLPVDLGAVLPFAWHALQSIRHLRRVIRRQGADVVFSVTRTSNLYAGIAGRLTGRRVVFHMHDVSQSRPALLLHSRLVRHCAHHVIAVSHHVLDAYRDQGYELDPPKTDVIYNGIDLDRFSPCPEAAAARRREMFPEGNYPIVTIVGRVSRFKGLEDFVRAARLVADEYPQARFLIVGRIWQRDLPWQETFDNLILDLGLSDHIVQLGHRSDVPDLMAVSNVIVLASWFESFGLSLVQGMAMAKPVVATRCGGPEEIVREGETGFLVPVREPSALADRILTLAREPDLAQQMGMAGRRRAADLFDVERFARQMLDFQAKVARQASEARRP
jgi:glycosyltransferase involved in cell wall biosynthesis